MKTKRFLSLVIAIVLCLSSFTAFAYEAEEVIVEAGIATNEPTVCSWCNKCGDSV